MHRITQTPIVPLLVALSGALGLTGCEADAASANAAAHGAEHLSGELLVTRPLRKDTELSQDYVCQIRAIQRIEVRALERGYLQEIYVDEGKSIREGQRLFQIMPTIYQAELDKSAAEADAARIEYKNTELLADKNVVSPNELAVSKAKLAKARAQQALSAAHRSLTTINAPFAGILGLLEVRRGSLLEEGELLTTLSDNRKMWVYFNVTEAEYLDYKARVASNAPTPVELILANGERFARTGTIETIEADFNNETGTIAFRATFDNPSGLLRHGQTGNVRIKRQLKQALLIPQAATFEVLDNKFVFVVDDEGVAHQRRVKIAEEMPHLYVVGDGLTERDRILVEGLRKVRDGSKVTARYEEPAAVFKTLDLPAN